ncbi:MAG TPA: glycosyltransferase family 4 protein [Alphaproteobacteria bacterium]|nr:glycosyltransferase family 4 protein [Alphaproteobacteria bacterium]
MNICLISAEYPPETAGGGIGTYTRALGQGLAERGHRVHVLSVSLDDRDHRRMDDRVYVHRVATARWPLPPLVRRRGSGIWALLERSRSVTSYLARLQETVGFDVIEAPNWGAEALLYSFCPMVPLVVRVSTPIATVAAIAAQAERPRLGLRLHRWLEALPVQRASAVIAHSQFTAGVIEREYGVPAERLWVVRLGLGLTVPMPKPHVETAGGPTDLATFKTGVGLPPDGPYANGMREHEIGPTVLYVGRLERRKGVRYLLEAIPCVVAAVPGVRFRLVGKDIDDAPGGTSYRAYFASFASPEAQAATTFLGFVDQAVLVHEYATCDLFVAPSLYESFGLVHLEAMGFGKPVVAFRAGATPETVIDGETGLLTPPGESGALAQAIIRLLRAPGEARRMGECGRARAMNQFSLDRMVEDTLAVYEAVGR